MGIARSTGVFGNQGTSESSGNTISSGSTQSGTETDILGDDTSAGEIDVYLAFTSTVTTGTIDVKISRNRLTGSGYSQDSAQFSIAPKSGTKKVHVGRFPASRYMIGDVTNNGTGANATNVALLYELFKYS